MKKNLLFFGWILSFVLVGCATENTALIKAVSDYKVASSNENVTKNAPVALEDARHAVEAAQSATEEADINSLAYVAQKRVEIASLTADTRVVEQKQADLRANAKTKLMGEIQENELAALQASNAQLEKQLSDEKAKKTARGTEMSFPEGAFFDVGKSNLKSGSALHLDKVAMALKNTPDRKVLIEGHTDNTGTDALNLKLSMDRAKSVGTYLTKKGVTASRITTQGYGKKYPVASNATVSGREQNRRVDIVILNQDQNPETARLQK